MLRNLAIISIRNLIKRKFYTILNILGLAFSISFSLLLWIYVENQMSYDKHFENSERIFRVNADFNMNGKRDIYSNAPRPVAHTLKSDFPEIEEATRLRGFAGLETHTGTLKVGERSIKTNKIFIADSTFFSVFSYEFIAGDRTSCLSEPNSIVLTEGLAIRLFGSSDVLGKTLSLTGYRINEVKITGILKDSNENTHLSIEALTYWPNYDWEKTRWYGGHVYTYIVLDKRHNISSVESKIPEFFNTYMKETFDELNGTASFKFQPLTEIYLDKEYVWEPYPHGSRENVSALKFIIVFLLVFACINYINLATARSSERAAEVGIRKALGSSKRQLLLQFLSESVLLAFASGIIALILSALLLPFFNDLSGLGLTALEMISLERMGWVLLLSVSIGIGAGLYPATYLSSLNSLKILKGKFAASNKGELLRRILVTAQYGIAALLISSVLIVSQQTRFVMNKDVGYDKENIFLIEAQTDSVSSKQLELFSRELKRSSSILGTSNSRYSLEEEANHFTPTLINPDGSTFQKGADLISVDHDFVETIGLKLLQGRNFDKQMTGGEYGILINEAARKDFGWDQNPLEGRMEGWREDENGNKVKYRVLGVVQDFNLGVSYQNINPLIIFLDKSGRGKNLFVRMNGGQIFETMQYTEERWNEYFPSKRFEYSFLDQSLATLYEKESKFLKLLSSFSVIIVFIACLGIIGLISYTSELKRKEIAIRKVHGSPLKSIALLLTRKFIFLLCLANVIAIPVGIYLINLWLENFAHRIELSAWPYFVSLVVCALFTVVALTYHTLRAAALNPAQSLRNE